MLILTAPMVTTTTSKHVTTRGPPLPPPWHVKMWLPPQLERVKTRPWPPLGHATTINGSHNHHWLAINGAWDADTSRASTFFVCLFFLFFNLLSYCNNTNSYFSDCVYSTSNDGAIDVYERGPRQGKETIGARLRLHDKWRRPKTLFLMCLGPLVCPFYISFDNTFLLTNF